MATHFRRSISIALCSLGFLGCAATHRLPATPAPRTPEELDQFMKAVSDNFDVNHDGLLSEAEFTRAAMSMFESIDTNSDDMLSREEMGARWNTNCALADTDHDQALSLMEVMRDQNVRFKDNDSNHDGFLNKEELRTLLVKKYQQNPS